MCKREAWAAIFWHSGTPILWFTCTSWTLQCRNYDWFRVPGTDRTFWHLLSILSFCSMYWEEIVCGGPLESGLISPVEFDFIEGIEGSMAKEGEFVIDRFCVRLHLELPLCAQDIFWALQRHSVRFAEEVAFVVQTLWVTIQQPVAKYSFAKIWRELFGSLAYV